jgi:hypothetical protein
VVKIELALGLLLTLLLVGCAAVGEEGASKGAKGGGDGESSATAPAATSPSSGETTVGPAFAEAELRPVGDSGTHGTAVFKGVGPADVQVELDVSGLPTKDPDAIYFAQVHEGSCSDEHSDEPSGEGHEEYSAAAGPALALLVRFDRLFAEDAPLAKATGPQAHGGDEPGIPEVPPGRIDQPVTFSASSPDGSAFVTSLLEGVGPRRLTSGAPEYIHIHAVRPEGAPPEELACGDLRAARESG